MGCPHSGGLTFWVWPQGTGSQRALGQGMILGHGAGWQGQTDRWTTSPGKTSVAPSPGLSGATTENTEPLVWPGYCASQPGSQKRGTETGFQGGSILLEVTLSSPK